MQIDSNWKVFYKDRAEYSLPHPASQKLGLQAAQKVLRGQAREKSTSGGELLYVDAKSIERNEAYESFSAACSSAGSA
jgi:hypothetical protein